MKLPKPELVFVPEKLAFKLTNWHELATGLVVKITDKAGKVVYNQHQAEVKDGIVIFSKADMIRKPEEKGEELVLEAWFIGNGGEDNLEITKVNFNNVPKSKDDKGATIVPSVGTSLKNNWKKWLSNAFIVVGIGVMIFLVVTSMRFGHPTNLVGQDKNGITAPVIVPPLLSSSTNVTDKTTTNVSTSVVTQRITDITNVYGVTITNVHEMSNQFNLVNISNITRITHLNEVIGTPAEAQPASSGAATNVVTIVIHGDNNGVVNGIGNVTYSQPQKNHRNKRMIENQVAQSDSASIEKCQVFTVPDCFKDKKCGTVAMNPDSFLILNLKDGWTVIVEPESNGENLFARGRNDAGEEKAISPGSSFRGLSRISFYMSEKATGPTIMKITPKQH